MCVCVGTPCTPARREGLPWMESLLIDILEGRGEEGDLGILARNTQFIGGPHQHLLPARPAGAMEPLQGALKYFREDFEHYIRHGTRAHG